MTRDSFGYPGFAPPPQPPYTGEKEEIKAMGRISEGFKKHTKERLGDLDESPGRQSFSVRFPRDIEDKLLRVDNTKNTPLLRQIVVRAFKEHPEWVAEIETELRERGL